MKFSAEQVFEVLNAATYPMTTSEILEDVRLANDHPRFGGKASEVKPALDELVAEGRVVTAKRVRVDTNANPYQFIARASDDRANWYMTKTRAEDFRRELQRRDEILKVAQKQAQNLMAALHGARVTVEMGERSGKVTFKLTGDMGHLLTLVAALAAFEDADDRATWVHRVSSDDLFEPCGCLRNESGSHRAGCPDHPEGIQGG